MLHCYLFPQEWRNEEEERHRKGLPALPRGGTEEDVREKESGGGKELQNSYEKMMLSTMVGMLGWKKEDAIKEIEKQRLMNERKDG